MDRVLSKWSGSSAACVIGSPPSYLRTGLRLISVIRLCLVIRMERLHVSFGTSGRTIVFDILAGLCEVASDNYRLGLVNQFVTVATLRHPRVVAKEVGRYVEYVNHGRLPQ